MLAPRHGLVRRVLAIAVGVLLVAGLVGVVAVADEGSGSSASSGTDKLASGPAQTFKVDPDGAIVGDLDPAGRAAADLISDLHGFVAKHRGLSFTAAVEVTLFSPAGFVARLKEQSVRDETDRKELAETARVLAALRLMDKGIDVEAELDALLAGAVAGFYDPESKELAVRGADLDSPQVRTTIVHELTHALQDQHFDLDRPELDRREDEAAIAFSGVVEGDAVRVERMYVSSLPRAEQKRAEREELEAGSQLPASVPLVLLELIAFPYIFGPTFASVVVDKGGQARLDQAFVTPPTTTEQILDPNLFLAGQGATAVPKPEAKGTVIDEGVMGEYVLMLLLARTGDGSSSNAQAAALAKAWRGDSYRAWDDGASTCVRARLVTDGVESTRRLQAALNDWRGSRRDATVTVEPEGTLLFTSCA